MTLSGIARYWCKVCFKQNRGAFELVPRSALRYFRRYCNREDRVALANAEVMEVVRQALRSELEPINQRLGKLSDAVEMQGSNIASLTDMVDDIGERLRNVEAKESATQQRLARMREEFQQRQKARQAADMRSELSQEDFQDAEAYDPMHPTEGPSVAPQRPGLESTAISMQP